MKGKVLAKHCFPTPITETKQYRSISMIGNEETKCENYHHKKNNNNKKKQKKSRRKVRTLLILNHQMEMRE